jgi:hypothetical protein
MNTKNIFICGINISIFIISNHIIITMANGHLTLRWPYSSDILTHRPECLVALKGAWCEPSTARSHAYRAPHGDVGCLGWANPRPLSVGHLTLGFEGGPLVLGPASTPKLDRSCVIKFYWVLMKDFKYFNFYYN